MPASSKPAPQGSQAIRYLKDGKWVQAMKRAYARLEGEFPVIKKPGIAVAAVESPQELPIGHAHYVDSIVVATIREGLSESEALKMKDRFTDLILDEIDEKDECSTLCVGSESSETHAYRLPNGEPHSTIKTTFHPPFHVFANSEISNETAAEFHPYWSPDAQATIAFEILTRRATSGSQSAADSNKWANADLSNLYFV
jgi:hypothetical protein